MTDDLLIPDGAARVAVHLLKGVIYRDQHAAQWQDWLVHQAAIRQYLAVIGLQVIGDETEGYAYIKQKPAADDETALPRLVTRRPLSHPVSLLCALLRKKLVERDAGGGETRVVLSRADIVEMVQVFLPPAANEAKLVDQIDRHIAKVVELGFLRQFKGDEPVFEVRRIIKALVDADFLVGYLAKLDGYRTDDDAES